MDYEEKLERMNEMLLDIVKKISKSIECGEYSLARIDCANLEQGLKNANHYANRLADKEQSNGR